VLVSSTFTFTLGEGENQSNVRNAVSLTDGAIAKVVVGRRLPRQQSEQWDQIGPRRIIYRFIGSGRSDDWVRFLLVLGVLSH
jgi:hypothetical protein